MFILLNNTFIKLIKLNNTEEIIGTHFETYRTR